MIVLPGIGLGSVHLHLNWLSMQGASLKEPSFKKLFLQLKLSLFGGTYPKKKKKKFLGYWSQI